MTLDSTNWRMQEGTSILKPSDGWQRIPDAWQVMLNLLEEGTETCRGRTREEVGDSGSES